MHIKTSGTAIIRHKDTGQVFEVEADEISDLWDSVGAGEEPMGTRTTWEASIELPDLGTLTWQLLEYPEGAFNGTDTDVDGHELVSDFQITLEHDPEDSDAREADEAAIEDMIEWFHQNYEDPANRVPYESAKGGYQWIYGGPETPEEALGDNFGSVYRGDLIEQAATKITDDSGIYDWSPIPGADWAEDDLDIAPTPNVPEPEARAAVLLRIEALEQLIRPLVEEHGPPDMLPGIGHNQPPPEFAIEEAVGRGEWREVQAVIEALRAEATKPEPELEVVERGQNVFVRVLRAVGGWARDRINAGIDAGGAVLIGYGLADPQTVIGALNSVAQSVATWISSMPWPF